MSHEDHRYIEALLRNDSSVLKEIYRLFSPKIKAYILSNSGTEAEAKDIFQEALISIYRKASTENFQLTCPFEAYLFMVCRGKWLNFLNSSKKKKETNFDIHGFNNIQADEISTETLILEERLDLLESKLNELGDSCQSLLRKSWKGEAMKAVAESLKISYAYARKKKSECLAKLIALIKNDNLFNKFKA